MATRSPLPDDLRGRAFDREQAERAGVRPGRLRRKDLRRLWQGVHAEDLPESVLAACRAYEVRLKPGQFFTHETAAALHGLTLPTDHPDDGIHVGAVRPAEAPHARGVRGHRLLTSGPLEQVEELPVPDVVEVFCQLGATLMVEDLVVVADELMNRTALDEDAARQILEERISQFRRVGAARLLRAVASARRGARSPAETRIRCVLDAAGIPVAELNAPILERTTDRYLGSPDFVWRDRRVVLEYEGDEHRTRQSQFRYDIVRYDDLMADGWRVVRATGEHLTAAGRVDIVRRVRRALAG